MKIQAKKIQHMEARNGTAFSANIYVDGKKVGSVRDEGFGGELIIEIPKEQVDAIENHMNTLPNAKEDYLNSVEVFLSDLVLGELDNRDFKKLLRKPLYIMGDGKSVGEFRKLKWNPETKARLEAKYPEYVFLNNLPLNEAKPYLTA